MTSTDSVRKDTRYTLIGIIQSPIVRKDRNQQDWVAFQLAREGKTVVRCVAFGARAAVLITDFPEGTPAKIWGFFQKKSFTGSDGQPRASQEFHTLNISAPGAQADSDESEAEAA